MSYEEPPLPPLSQLIHKLSCSRSADRGRHREAPHVGPPVTGTTDPRDPRFEFDRIWHRTCGWALDPAAPVPSSAPAAPGPGTPASSGMADEVADEPSDTEDSLPVSLEVAPPSRDTRDRSVCSTVSVSDPEEMLERAATHPHMSWEAYLGTTRPGREVNAQLSDALLRGRTPEDDAKVILLKLSRRPKVLREVLLQAPELAQCREAMEERGFAVELDSGAKVFVRPEHYVPVKEALRLGGWPLHADNVLVDPALEATLLEVLERLPNEAGVRVRSAASISLGGERRSLEAFDSDGMLT